MLSVRLNDQRQPKLNISFDCHPGQLLALVGPSGAGKSTVLRCIAGLHCADAGYIESNGIDWFNQQKNINKTPQQRRVGFVFQNYALFPHLTVAENIKMASDNQADENLVDDLLVKVHLHGLAERYPHQLSGGQQQRVALARALARNPDVLLLDEPFSAVDKVTRRKLYLELNSLRQYLDMPIILVTHDLDEAAMLADTMVVIHHGRTLQQGSPAQVLYKPDTAEIAKLVDVRNVFTGKLIKKALGYKLQWQSLELDIDGDYSSQFSNQSSIAVSWTISPAKVILHQRVKPSRGEHENPIRAYIKDMLTLRGVTTVLLALIDGKGLILQMDISEHVAVRNQLKIGETVAMSLLADAIHIIYQ